MAGTITWIDPVRDVIKPARFGSDHPMRTVTQQISGGGGWSPERASFVAGVFDELSVDWHDDHSARRAAGAAGRRAGSGRSRRRDDVVEIGCGTGRGH